MHLNIRQPITLFLNRVANKNREANKCSRTDASQIKNIGPLTCTFVVAKRYVTLNTEHVGARRSGMCGSVDEEDHVN